MAIRFTEPFDELTLASFGLSWIEALTNLGDPLTLVPGKHGGTAMRVGNIAPTVATMRAVPPNISGVRVVVSMRIRALRPQDGLLFLRIVEAGNSAQLTLRLRHDLATGGFTLEVVEGAAGPVYPLATEVFAPDYWHHIELVADLFSTNFDWEVRSGGLTVGSGSTPGTGTAGWAKVRLNIAAESDSGSYIDIDDLVLADGSLDKDNTWLGDVVVDRIIPNGRGVRTEWDIAGSSPANTNWGSVDDAKDGDSDDDTTYVRAGQYDMWESYQQRLIQLRREVLTLLPQGDSKYEVGPPNPGNWSAVTVRDGLRVATLFRTNGTDYVRHRRRWTEDPFRGDVLRWLPEDVAASEFGIYAAGLSQPATDPTPIDI